MKRRRSAPRRRISWGFLLGVSAVGAHGPLWLLGFLESHGVPMDAGGVHVLWAFAAVALVTTLAIGVGLAGHNWAAARRSGSASAPLLAGLFFVALVTAGAVTVPLRVAAVDGRPLAEVVPAGFWRWAWMVCAEASLTAVFASPFVAVSSSRVPRETKGTSGRKRRRRAAPETPAEENQGELFQ